MFQLKYVSFAVYLFLFGMYGIQLSSFGTTILYFSKYTHRDQTSFSYIFLASTIGNLVGGFFMKWLPNYFAYHRLFAVVIAISALAHIISSLDFGFWNLSITLGIIGATQGMIDILCTLCIFQLFFKENEDYWLQICHTFVGVGGLVGPVIVVLTQQLSLRAIGIIFLLGIAPLLILKSPEKQKNNGQIQDEDQQQDKQLLQLPLNAQVGLCIMMFTYVGLIASYINWIPTYAVKSGALNQTSANLLVTIFWVVELIAKVILLFFQGTVPSKSFFLLKSLFISGIILVILQWFQYYTVVCYFGVISAGFFLSALYAFFYTLAQSYGYRLDQSATANMTILSVLAEALLAPIGYIIGVFGFKSFVYSIFVLNCAMLAIFIYTTRIMEKDSKEKKQFLQNGI